MKVKCVQVSLRETKFMVYKLIIIIKILDSLDDCGLRFLLAMKHYNYLLRCLGVAQRTQFQKRGMCSADIAWAFHSESEEELLQLTPSYVRGTPRWSALKELGVGWWLRNQTLLRTCIEKVSFCFKILV